MLKNKPKSFDENGKKLSFKEKYGKKHFKKEIYQTIENFKTKNIFDNISEKSDKKMLEGYDNSELSEGWKYVVVNFFGYKTVMPSRINEDGSRTNLATFSDEYFNNIQKYLSK